MIGTTRFMSDGAGSKIEPAVYTAFGERIDGTNHRYGYAGAWGYQAHDEMPFLHVGHRYYDPATGRFLQRDPIGLRGGLNVYAYVHSRPTIWIDPDGLKNIVGSGLESFGDGAIGAGTAGAAVAGVCLLIPVLAPAAPEIGAASGAMILVGFVAKAVGKLINWFF